MKEEPLISIITVVYNGKKTIEQTILSVLDQTYKNIEYIIIDGGSTDGTLEVIRKYEDQINFWISEPDNGLYDAMNKGIAITNGRLIGMINSDDWYEPEAVELVVNAYLRELDKKIFHGDRYDVTPSGEKRLYRFNPSEFKFFCSSMTYNHPSMFVHRSIYKSCYYNTSLESYADYEFVLTQYLKQPDVFKYLPVPYVNYRLDGISAEQSLFQNIKEGVRARVNSGLGIRYAAVFILIKPIKNILRSVFGIKYFNELKPF